MFYDNDYTFEMSIHQVQIELSAYARKEKRRMENTKPLKSWRSDSYGSASCSSSSFDKIFDAYNEYREACYCY